MKKVLIGLMVILVGTTAFMGCDEIKSSDEKVADKQEQLAEESNRKVGMPNIKNFFEKEIHKEILELRDDPNLINYAYIQNMDGKFTYIGQCVGYPLPYSTQYTNPEYYEYYRNGGGSTLPQQDPNGLFSSGSASATWIMLLDEKGERKIGYFENELVVTQHKIPERLITEWSLTDNY